MTGLRVDLVSEHASPLATLGGDDAGGQNVHVAALATHLGRLGCEVTVLTRADARRLPARVPLAPGVTVEHVEAGPRQPVPKDSLFDHMGDFAAHLRRRWTAARPDVVHAHFWMSGWAALQAAADLADPPPVAQTFHALGAVKRRHQGRADTSPRARARVESELVDRMDHIVATCTDELAELAALGARPGRVSVIPCGVEPAEFRPTGLSVPRTAGRHRLVVVSRLVPRKGVGNVIEALVDLPGTELVVAGGPAADRLDDDPEAARLRRLAADLGVADRVMLLGSVTRSQVPPLMRSADLVVCVPWYEPFGIVPLEAMACGVPVVGSAVGGLLDTVADGRTGVLVPPRDPAAVAAACAHLLANPSLRRHMGAEAAAQVRERYSWRHVARCTKDVYERLAAGAPGAPAPGRARNWAVPA